MKVYITKWALTRGIIEANGEPSSHGFVSAKVPPHRWPAAFGPREWCDNLDGARVMVDEMIAARRKTLARVEARLRRIEEKGCRVVKIGEEAKP